MQVGLPVGHIENGWLVKKVKPGNALLHLSFLELLNITYVAVNTYPKKYQAHDELCPSEVDVRFKG